MKSKRIVYNPFPVLLLFLTSLVLVQCELEPEWRPLEDAEMQIMEYIQDDSVNFSEFYSIAEHIGLSGILSTRGPFTLFLPDNAAFQAYYVLKGKNSYTDFTDDELIRLLRNHVIPAEITTSDIGLGSIGTRNAIGDYLVSEFDGDEIIINKYSKITKRNITVANGVIHKIDRVIDPISLGTYSTFKEFSEYSIFTQGLEKAGLSDTLDILEIPYGRTTARVRYTILAVPDSVFNAHGIFSVDDLVARFDDGVGNLYDLDNGFFQYMAYHCLENTYYMTTITNGTYYIITRENSVTFNVGLNFEINPTPGDSVLTTFIDKYSNIPAKNGVIHGITQLLIPDKPTPREYFFDTTSFPEFEAMEGYKVGETTVNFYDGENGFEKIKWNGDYLQYWCKFQGTGFINDDCIVMPEGYWSIEITLPKITRGKYEMWGYFKKGSNRANVIVYLDGERIDQVLELNSPSLVTENVYICDVDFPSTQEHVVKVVTVYPGVMMWDSLRFYPIEE
ncbi:MAG TPA: fasciclin domain-containing protein [Prolixibacteraceae bacterium]|nr:fasciclin domain-containing protein [Prolixibacteraceae bacterium]